MPLCDHRRIHRRGPTGTGRDLVRERHSQSPARDDRCRHRSGDSRGSFGTSDPIVGLAFDADSRTLFGTDTATDQLWTIDTNTGLATPVGPLIFRSGDRVERGHGLASNSGGGLFGTDTFFDDLLRIDKSTAIPRTVGSLGFDVVEGVAFDAGSDTLYGVDAATKQLLTIAPAMGAAIAVGNLGFSGASGLAFDSGVNTLYATDERQQLWNVDPDTGAGTLIGRLGDTRVEGLAFDPASPIPEPSSIVLLGIGAVSLGGFGGLRRRKRKRAA